MLNDAEVNAYLSPARSIGADGSIKISAVICELCDSIDYYRAHPAAAAVLEAHFATPVMDNMLSTARYPVYTSRDDLLCTMGSNFSHTEGVQPRYYRVWALHTQAEIENAILQLREGAVDIPGDIAVEAKLKEIISHFCHDGILSDRVIVSAASAGTFEKIDAIFAAHVIPRIDPGKRIIDYWVDADIVYTRPSRRGRGAATAAAWLANDKIEDDLYALDAKVEGLNQIWSLKTKIAGEVHHPGAERLIHLFEATLKDFPMRYFETSAYERDWSD